MSGDYSASCWIGSLSDYNAGRLVGLWLDLPCDQEDLDKAIETVKAMSEEDEPEEFWCLDIECEHGFLDGECSPARAKAITDAVERFESETHLSAEVLAAYRDCVVGSFEVEDIATYIETVPDRYRGVWNSEAEYAEELARDCGLEIPDWLDHYIDWESYARDMAYGGELDTLRLPDGTYHVFH